MEIILILFMCAVVAYLTLTVGAVWCSVKTGEGEMSEKDTNKGVGEDVEVSEPTLALIKAINSEIVPEECWEWYVTGMSIEELKSFRYFIQNGDVIPSSRFSTEIEQMVLVPGGVLTILKDLSGNSLSFENTPIYYDDFGFQRVFENVEGVFNPEESKLIVQAIQTLHCSTLRVVYTINREIAKIEQQQKTKLVEEKRSKLMRDYCGGIE